MILSLFLSFNLYFGLRKMVVFEESFQNEKS